MNIPNLLVTGVNGLVGQEIIAQLAEKNVKIIGTGRGKCRIYKPSNFIYLENDLSKPQQLIDILETYPIETIIHCAALTNVDYCELNPHECWLINTIAIQELLPTIQRKNIHFIYVSTDFVFDGSAGPYAEEDKPNPLSVYARSKYQAETLIQQHLDPQRWAIARTILVYSTPNEGRSNIVLWVKNNLEAGKSIQVVIDQVRSPSFAADVAHGLIQIAHQRAAGIYHLGGPELMTIHELTNRVARFWNLDTSLIKPVLSDTIKQPAKRPPITGLLISKAIQQLNYQPKFLEEGLHFIDQFLKKQ